MNSTVKLASYGEALKNILKQEGQEKLFLLNTLGKCPHIVDKIFLLWDEPENAHRYFVGLMTTQRENRAGFPMDVYTELFTLEKHYIRCRPNFQKVDDYWSSMNRDD